MASTLSSGMVPINAKLEFFGIPDQEDIGTADSLRLVADRVKTNILVVSCDLITDGDFLDLMSVHRKNESCLTVMLSQLPNSITTDVVVPGFKAKQRSNLEEKISMGFDFNNMEHIVYWKAQVDMEDEFVAFTKKFLNRFPCARIQSNWTDCHAYLIKDFILKYLKDKREVSSVQGELVPLVVKKQMSVFQPSQPQEESSMASPNGDLKLDKKKDLIHYAGESSSSLSHTVQSLSLTSPNFGTSNDAPRKNLIGCYAYRQTEGFCVRANTIAAFAEASKQMPRLTSHFLPAKQNAGPNVPEGTVIKSKSQVGADSMLGENVTIGEKVSIKKSVVGKNCTIGDGVKITNSVVMDGVSISQSCTISNCIVSQSAKIETGCQLSNCIIGDNQTIATMSIHNNDVLSNLAHMMSVPLE
ncbi:translation initiation factor eIF-2B subunit gamma [Elysia marginata]|uniref:Translation initiation factor eIF2B subunit gamma n=1 Tax=Elysia marginata TaxID=1093978 RepID=A0AAV4H0J8_9GAST|nr:translation initiation factor eIF-2B subunit gamma [Elysia marginata]